MPSRINHLFEAVKIDEEDRECRAGRCARRDERLELLIQVAGVVEPGQTVAHGELAEALLVRAERILGTFAIGGVDAGREDLDQPALCVDDRCVAPRDLQTLAVARHVLVLVGDVVLRMAEQVVDHRDEIASRRLGVRDDEFEHRSPDELLLRVAEQALAELVHEDDAALGIPTQHDGIGPIDDLAVDPLLAAKPRQLTAEAANFEPCFVVATTGHRTYSTPSAGRLQAPRADGWSMGLLLLRSPSPRRRSRRGAPRACKSRADGPRGAPKHVERRHLVGIVILYALLAADRAQPSRPSRGCTPGVSRSPWQGAERLGARITARHSWIRSTSS